MGMLIGGNWTHGDRIINNGNYDRPTSVFASSIPQQVVENIIDQSGRYLLIGSNSCQWSHRTMIFRQLKGLNNHLPPHIAHGPRKEGYALDGGKLWQVPGTEKRIRHLHQLYSLSDPSYTGRTTVPILWDSYTHKIISNESSKILRALDAVQSTQSVAPANSYFPKDLNEEMANLDELIYHGLSNGVYKAGFAQSQAAYDKAVILVFETMDRLETRLTTKRYLFGDMITASDWMLFTTLVRFDLVYYPLHRCMKRRLTDYPNLWEYALELYQFEGISTTVDFREIRHASYSNDTENNKFNIVPICPDIDWNSPHNRGRLPQGDLLLFQNNQQAPACDVTPHR